MRDPEHQDHEAVLFEGGDDAVVADPVTPQPGEVAGERPAERLGSSAVAIRWRR